jgi:hypothetical protein
MKLCRLRRCSPGSDAFAARAEAGPHAAPPTMIDIIHSASAFATGESCFTAMSVASFAMSSPRWAFPRQTCIAIQPRPHLAARIAFAPPAGFGSAPGPRREPLLRDIFAPVE